MRKSSEKWKMRMSAENWEMRMSSEKWKLRMSNLPRLVVTLLILPLATPSLYSSKDQVGDCIQFCYCYFYVYFYLYVYFYFASSEKIQFWYFYFHPTDSRWWSSMQTTSTQHWRVGSMPGWSSSMPAGRKSFWAGKIDLRHFLEVVIGFMDRLHWEPYPTVTITVFSEVWLLSEPVTHFQGAGERNGKLARCHPGASTILTNSKSGKWQAGRCHPSF